MTHHERLSRQGDCDIRSRRQRTKPNMIRARAWKDGAQSSRGGEMNRIVKSRICAHSTLESAEAVNFPE
jgi:hypothetical protein